MGNTTLFMFTFTVNISLAPNDVTPCCMTKSKANICSKTCDIYRAAGVSNPNTQWAEIKNLDKVAVDIDIY